eukprot:2095599-Prorocentrum_lima.AAC.1
MTSSLVGSEMCIRDRVKIKFKGGIPTLFPASTWKDFVAQSQNRVSSGSVSYTHLTLPTICSV